MLWTSLNAQTNEFHLMKSSLRRRCFTTLRCRSWTRLAASASASCSTLMIATGAWVPALAAPAQSSPAPQRFRQEIAHHTGVFPGLVALPPQLLTGGNSDGVRVFSGGVWHELARPGAPAKQIIACENDESFSFPDAAGHPVKVAVPWRGVLQLLTAGTTHYVVHRTGIVAVAGQRSETIAWGEAHPIQQLAASPTGEVIAAARSGLFCREDSQWIPVRVPGPGGLDWGRAEALGAAFDSAGRLWLATPAGAACRTASGWRFFEGKDGLPWNEFTTIAPGPQGEIWFATTKGAIRYEAGQWHYRQGARWLADDHLSQALVDPAGNAWFATSKGLSCIERREMTLAEKAEHYEREIERYVKRTPFGFVAEARLRAQGDRTSADPDDSDNDGLWTAMYGAGECFAFAATGDPRAKERARTAFEALRFLQKVTQGGTHAPPKGFVARTVRSVDLPDPNLGSVARDQEHQKSDRLWKVYEPRWPKSADQQWYWKSDTSSDELDGHYFFYPQYYDFCADTPAEKERVREVVRDLTDHLLAHDFNLVDHDGRPTRWGIYSPASLNHNQDWWGERGLKSLSILSYLAVAAHITGDPKYTAAARRLVDDHGYAHNLMHPKVQHGPGSGNQSDDEMAVMCFYNLLRYSPDDKLKDLVRISFYRYWANEEPEMNPFFNFAYAALNPGRTGDSPFGPIGLDPWAGWHTDAMATLYGFPLDRLNWPHQNSHRLDLVRLWPIQAVDFAEVEHPRTRGYRVNGKVMPVENRHFNHWNTDPWRLDYGGSANELAAGTVFLLPYYLGLYHGYIEKP